ncbi:MAG TPA: SDR family oxidoreductase [Candidatus Omnitrophota bacterium]|nr:SDR family oxidoreductase [Candidatus Omnitrophota bacterium]
MTQPSKPTVLITGGAKRIGKAICLALAKAGYKIALHYQHSHQEALGVLKQIKKNKGQCELFACDLSKDRATGQLIKMVKKTCPDLSILVNNASIFEKSNIRSASLASLNKHFDINFKAPFILTQEFTKACRNGLIINILDTNIVRNTGHHATYLLSKKALAELTKMSAVELAPSIRVNAVAPGLILPPEGETAAYLDRRVKAIPLKRKGDAAQIAQTVLFLIENPYVTGQIIFNDGGEHLI